jgi:hypothetical protein
MTHGLRMYAVQCGHAMWLVRLSHLIQGLRLTFFFEGSVGQLPMDFLTYTETSRQSDIQPTSD